MDVIKIGDRVEVDCVAMIWDGASTMTHEFSKVFIIADIYVHAMYMHMYVCMYTCMHMIVCMYVCMYVWIY